MDGAHQRERAHARRGGATINRDWTIGEAVNRASQRGAQDHGGLKNGGAPGYRIGKMLGGHQKRHESLTGRSVEGSHGSVEQKHRVDGPNHGEPVQ